MSSLSITEGHVPFSVPSAGIPCQIYYKKVTEGLQIHEARKTGPVLIVVHGGPTFGHNYLLPLQEMAYYPSICSVLFYD